MEDSLPRGRADNRHGGVIRREDTTPYPENSLGVIIVKALKRMREHEFSIQFRHGAVNPAGRRQSSRTKSSTCEAKNDCFASI
jgi:hypothetical protein